MVILSPYFFFDVCRLSFRRDSQASMDVCPNNKTESQKILLRPDWILAHIGLGESNPKRDPNPTFMGRVDANPTHSSSAQRHSIFTIGIAGTTYSSYISIVHSFAIHSHSNTQRQSQSQSHSHSNTTARDMPQPHSLRQQQCIIQSPQRLSS